MEINKITNNGTTGYQIIDADTEYFLVEETEEKAIAKYKEIIAKKNEVRKPTYKELRLKEYPSLAEQMDLIYWDKINKTNNWESLITEIKNKYPKV
jgi:hypothetical protein